jgi:pimeloyl-ACP methyl ester carboxylesterase
VTTTTLELTSADGTPLVVESTGGGEPLLLLHGGMNSTRVFDRALPALSSRYRCLALGRRGYGQSGTAPTHSFEAEAGDVATVLAALDEPAHLFGHSSGAVAAATAALADGSRLRSLVLYEPPFPVERPHSGPWMDAVENAVARGDNEEAAIIGLRDGIGFSAAQLARVRADPGWANRIALAPAWIREVRSVEALPVGVDRFAAVTVPTLLMTGSETEPHHADAINALHAIMPRSEISVLKGQGHTAILLAPEVFSDALAGYLDRR